MIETYTIGFTKKTAEQFFSKLRAAGVERMIDVRLHNSSQLSGFAKQKDLQYFLKELAGIDYQYFPELAPTKEILDTYKKHGGEWSVYEQEFLLLMSKREIEKQIPKELLQSACLLCSEHLPKQCHRRLVLDYLDEQWGGIKVNHLT